MGVLGFYLNSIDTVLIVLILVTQKVESSGGFRESGNRSSETPHVVERIQKSRHTIVHRIEVKSEVGVLYLQTNLIHLLPN